MKIAVKKWILPVLIGGALLLQWHVVSQARAKIPSSAFIHGQMSLKPSEYEEETYSIQVAPCIREKSWVEGEKADVVYTSANYEELAGLNMKYGAFLTEKKQAVISDRLATKLYFKDDVLGAPLTINGEEYSVGGVYWSEQTETEKMSEGLYSQVFLSLKSYKSPEGEANEFFVSLKDNEAMEQTFQKLQQEMGIFVQEDEAENLQENRRLIEQHYWGTWLFIGLCLILWNAWRFGKRACSLGKKLWQQEEKRTWKEGIPLILSSIGFLAGILLTALFSFSLVLPQKFVIFEGSVADYILLCVRTANTLQECYIVNYTYRLMRCSALLCLMTCAGAVAQMFLCSTRKDRHKWEERT